VALGPIGSGAVCRWTAMTDPRSGAAPSAVTSTTPRMNRPPRRANTRPYRSWRVPAADNRHTRSRAQPPMIFHRGLIRRRSPDDVLSVSRTTRHSSAGG